MKKITILIVMALLCLNTGLKAQNSEALNLGQKIPSIILNKKYHLLNSTIEKDSLSLSEFKGKLILIDFWATWCASCIYKFEHLEKLQHQFNNEFKVILVSAKSTKDTPTRIMDILSGKKAPFIKTNLASIYNDEDLSKLFVHHYLPHYVWLNEKGEVLAFTNASLITEQTILTFLEGISHTNSQTSSSIKN